MSNYDKLHHCRASIAKAELELQEARDQLDGISADAGELPAVITPTRFEAAYRALARDTTAGGHDYYDQWTPAGQAAYRRHTRAVLEGAGFQVQEDPR